MAAKKRSPAKKKAKRKSGGARATQAKHARRDAARRRGAESAEQSAQRFQRLLQTTPAEGADTRERIKWLAAVCIEAVADALNDVGLPPEQRRDQIVRMAEKAMKVCEPAKLAEQLDELYGEYEKLEQAVRKGGSEDSDAG